MWTGFETEAMPYSDRTMTRAPSRFRVGDQLAGDGVDLAQIVRDARMVGSKALEVVIEVRKVDEGQRRRAAAAHMQRRLRNPA